MFRLVAGQLLFDAEGGGGGAPAPTGAGGGEHPVPWAGAEGMWNIGEGEAAKPWFTGIPDEAARAHVEAKQYANPSELALANYNLTRLQTGDPNVVAIPGADATPEAKQSFWGKLGTPEKPEGYEFSFGSDVKVDDSMMDFGRQAFHKANLTPEQAQVMADAWNTHAQEATNGMMVADREANDAAMTALEASWGKDLAVNKAAGARVMKALDLSPETSALLESNIGSAAVVELFAKIGLKSAEGKLMENSQEVDPNNPDTMDAEQATSRMAQLRADPEFDKKLNDRNHPEHKTAVSILERLAARTT